MSNEPMESHGLRLAPEVWRRIEFQATRSKQDRSTWLREQIDWLLTLHPEVPITHEEVRTLHINTQSQCAYPEEETE